MPSNANLIRHAAVIRVVFAHVVKHGLGTVRLSFKESVHGIFFNENVTRLAYEKG